MLKKLIIMSFLIALLSQGNVCLAQKQEINAFREMNEKLLKSVKKEYKKEPRVELKDNVFFIVVEGKVNKKKMLMVLNENGDLLTPEPVTSYAPFPNDKNYVWFSNQYGDKDLFGIVDYRNGQVVLQQKYSKVDRHHSNDAGKVPNGVWRDATTDCWIAYDPANNETVFLSLDGKTTLNRVNGEYNFQDGEYVVAGDRGRKGLYTMDGKEIMPQSYYTFRISKDGFVVTTANNPDLTPWKLYYGGKMINPAMPQYQFNNDLMDLKFTDGVPYYKVHRDDDWISYAAQPAYTVSYIDEGQKYYDNGEYDKVIAYYEGEGIDAPHGGYYMGLASKAIGDAEMTKLDNLISTLKDPDKYYLPVKNPENYTFNATLLGSQFILAQDYFDRFLKNNDTNADDPRVKRAKKYRGEAAVSRNSVARKIEDYTTAYTAASSKYSKAVTNQAIQQAQQEALSNSIATGISNLILGK